MARSSFGSFVRGSVIGAAAMYLLAARRRKARGAEASSVRAAPDETRAVPDETAEHASLNEAERPEPEAAREVGPVDVGDLPDDLSLHEMYDRVSFH